MSVFEINKRIKRRFLSKEKI